MYFDVAKFSYLQAGVLLPYVALAPTIVAAGFTLGVMQQIVRAFSRAESSLQFLVRSWPTIVELISDLQTASVIRAGIRDQSMPKWEAPVTSRDF